MSAPLRTVEEAGGAWLRLVFDAPPGHLLSLAMVRALADAVAAARAGVGLRWLTVEGSGGQFSYGASIPEHLPEPMREVLPATHALVRDLLAFPAPTAALVELFQADGDPQWLAWATRLHESLDALFGAPDDQGWLATTGEDPTVLLRQLEEYDGAEPAASSVAVMNLLALARLTGRAGYQAKAERVLAAWGGRLRSQPRVAPFMLAALSVSVQPPIEIVVVDGDGATSATRLRHAVAARFLPSAVVVPVTRTSGEGLAAVASWAAAMTPREGRATAYVCRDFVCATPVTEPEDLVMRLDELTHPGARDDAGVDT